MSPVAARTSPLRFRHDVSGMNFRGLALSSGLFREPIHALADANDGGCRLALDIARPAYTV